MEELTSGIIFYIINQELNLAWDLSREDKTFVVGAKPNKQVSQKWIFEQINGTGYWTIENAFDQKYANVASADPIRPGVKVVTANPRYWEVRFDIALNGWRIVIPNTKLNAEIALLGHPLPEMPVTLGEELAVKNQVWKLEAAK